MNISNSAVIDGNTVPSTNPSEPSRTGAPSVAINPVDAILASSEKTFPALKGLAVNRQPVEPEAEPEKKFLSGLWQQFVKVSPTNFVHKSLGDWSLNPVVGCHHACAFCFVPAVSAIKQAPKLRMLGVRDPDAEWGRYAFVRGWNEEEFRKSLAAAYKTDPAKLAGDGHRAIMFSTTTDPYQVIKHADPKECKRLTEELQRIVRRALEIIRDETDLRVRILTRSPLAQKDFDLFKSFGDRLLFGMSLPTLNNKLARVYEPKAPCPTQRLKTLREAKAHGLNVYVAVAPTYAECGEDDIRATLETVKELNPVTIFHEPINMRAENVARIQAQADKEGIELKTAVFATPEAWANYSLDQLRLVERIAKDVGVYDRLHLWPDADLARKKFVAAQADPVAYQQWLDSWWTRISEWPGVNGGKAGRLVPEKPVVTTDAAASPPVPLKAATPSARLQAGLTVRTPDEILAFTFDPNDRYLDNGVFAREQSLTILGSAGLGKSRLVFQLAACTILGRDFLGMNVRSKGLKWLLLQAENSNIRLHADLTALKKAFSGTDWKMIQANLHVHTLETLEDAQLSLGDKDAADNLHALVRENQPDVIVLDPLASFATGSLTSDAGMQATVKACNALARAGGKTASVVVLHHTLTGKAGMIKAAGLERGGFGRGSKMLNAWTRGQINLAPATSDSNDRLVMMCGKNSNGAEFDPVGVRLNRDTMLYEVDSEFNLEEWQAEVGVARAKPKMPTPAFLRELVTAKPMKKKALVEAIKEHTGAEKSTAYTAIGAAVEAGKIVLGIDKKYAAAAA